MNRLYITNMSDGKSIDVESLTLSGGQVTEAKGVDGNSYQGAYLDIRTDKDFIPVPDLGISLSIGDMIYLDNQSQQRWTVRCGWYEVDGNPAIFGWYLESAPPGRVRSLYLKDLNSLTAVESHSQIVGTNIYAPSPIYYPAYCRPEVVCNYTCNCNCSSGGVTPTPEPEPETFHYILKNEDGTHSGSKYIVKNEDGTQTDTKYQLATE